MRCSKRARRRAPEALQAFNCDGGNDSDSNGERNRHGTSDVDNHPAGGTDSESDGDGDGDSESGTPAAAPAGLQASPNTTSSSPSGGGTGVNLRVEARATPRLPAAGRGAPQSLALARLCDSESDPSTPAATAAALQGSPGPTSKEPDGSGIGRDVRVDSAPNLNPNEAGLPHVHSTPPPPPPVSKRRRIARQPSSLVSAPATIATEPDLVPIKTSRWSLDEKAHLRRMLADGFTQAQIGRSLGRSSNAVSVQVAKLREKGQLPEVTNASGPAKSKTGPALISAATPFTEDEDRILLHSRRRNAPFSDIAKCLGRSAHSCHTRYDVLIEQQERKPSSPIAPPALYVPPPHAQTALLPSEVPLAGSEALAALARVQKASPTPMMPDVHQHATMYPGWKDVVTMLDEAAKGGDPFGFGSFGGGGEGEGQQERTIADPISPIGQQAERGNEEQATAKRDAFCRIDDGRRSRNTSGKLPTSYPPRQAAERAF
ncbi:hypothetical protein JCM8202_001880 [Rhodotorula sphaerocarpa]